MTGVLGGPTDLVMVAVAAALPVVVTRSGIYEPGVSRRGVVAGSIGLFVGVATVATATGDVPGVVRAAVYAVVGASFLLHLGAGVRAWVR